MRRLKKTDLIGNSKIYARYMHIPRDILVHVHEFYEIEYVLSGSGYYILNGETIPFQEGLLSFMTPLDYHSLHTECADIINIMFTSDFATQEYLQPLLRHLSSKVFVAEPQAQPFIRTILDELIEHQNTPVYCSSLIDCLLLKLSFFLPVNLNAPLNHAISKMHFYVLDHFQDNISLESAAAYAGLSMHYASALFKQEMQVNFKTYLSTLRFNHAKKLLLSTNETVETIGRDSGFENIPHFIRRFKEQFGVTPSQFRRNSLQIDGKIENTQDDNYSS